MASFSTLPIELLRLVVGSLSRHDQRHALAALAATPRRNHWLFNGMLYQADIAPGPSLAMLWAAATGNLRTLQLAVARGADVNYFYELGHTSDSLGLLGFAFGLLPLEVLEQASSPRYIPSKQRPCISLP
jgi:hypothetical protein